MQMETCLIKKIDLVQRPYTNYYGTLLFIAASRIPWNICINYMSIYRYFAIAISNFMSSELYPT